MAIFGVWLRLLQRLSSLAEKTRAKTKMYEWNTYDSTYEVRSTYEVHTTEKMDPYRVYQFQLYFLPPVNSFMASARASIDSMSKLFVGSSCDKNDREVSIAYQKS